MSQRINLIGHRFGRLTVVELAGSTPAGVALWRCRCDCGNVTTVNGQNLRRENTRSCGCLAGRVWTPHGYAPAREPIANADAIAEELLDTRPELFEDREYAPV
jgi:hypothetical protein